MIEQPQLSSLKVKDKLEHFLLLTGLSVKSTKTGKEYLDLELRDNSASRNAKMWGNFDSFLPKAEVGMVVKILGSLDEFKGQPQIKIERIRVSTQDDNVNPADFLPKSIRPANEMEKELNERINKISDQNLKNLLAVILNEENFNKYMLYNFLLFTFLYFYNFAFF